MHLGLDQMPFLSDIKESLGIDHDFMIVVSEESAYGRVDRCRYSQVVDGMRIERSAYWQNLDEVMADEDILEALNFGEELVIPKGQSFKRTTQRAIETAIGTASEVHSLNN